MSDEYAEYEVPGRQLRYRAAQLNTAGIPFQVNPIGGGVYIIVVPMAYAGGMEQLPQPHRSRKPWWLPNRRGLVTLAMVAVVGVGIYMVLSGGIAIKGVDVSGVKLPTVELPTVELPSVTAPLDQTAASVNHAADAAKNAAVTFAYAVGSVIALGALWVFRGPLAMAARGLAGAVQMLGKAVRRG